MTRFVGYREKICPNTLMRRFASMICLCTLPALLLGSASVFAGVYQWRDANGKINYGDQIPPEASTSGYGVLAPDGREIKKVEGVKSPEQLRRERALAQRRAELERQQRLQARYDRSLLATYSHVTDIDKLRDERIGLVDSTIALIRSKIEKVQRQLEAAENRRINFLTKKRKPPRQLEANIEQYNRQLANYFQQIDMNHRRKQQIREKFSKDRSRFLELQASGAYSRTDQDLP